MRTGELSYSSSDPSLLTPPPPSFPFLSAALFSFVTILGAVLQATVFGSVAVILASADEDAVTFQKKMLKINHRMAYLDMPLDMQERVRTYYQKMWDTERSLTVDPDQFISEVSKPLGADIKMRLYQNLLVKVTFLQNLNDIVVEELVKSLKTMLYLEGDLVMRKGESGNWMGLINKGQIAVLSPVDGKIIRIMENGDYLGEMALLYRVNRTVDIRALAWVSMLVLSSEDLARIKEDYPDDIFALEEELEAMMVAKQYKHVDVSDSESGSDESGDEEHDEDDNEQGDDDDESKSTPSSSFRKTKKIHLQRAVRKAMVVKKLGKKKSSSRLVAKSNSSGSFAMSIGEEDESFEESDEDSDEMVAQRSMRSAKIQKAFSSNKLETGRNMKEIAKKIKQRKESDARRRSSGDARRRSSGVSSIKISRERSPSKPVGLTGNDHGNDHTGALLSMGGSGSFGIGSSVSALTTISDDKILGDDEF